MNSFGDTSIFGYGILLDERIGPDTLQYGRKLYIITWMSTFFTRKSQSHKVSFPRHLITHKNSVNYWTVWLAASQLRNPRERS